MSGPVPPVVWITSELYYPELTSTGWYVTGLAESLAPDFDVRVICARPNYAARWQRAPGREHRNGVTILRCATFGFDTNRIGRRVAGALFQTAAMSALAFRHFRRGDIVVIGTNPPSLPYCITALARWRGLGIVLHIHDLYPDVLICSGLLRAEGAAARVLSALERRLYRGVDRVVTDGRDARRLVAGRSSRPQDVYFIPWWAEADLARPRPPERSFVALYSGNMGRMHDLPTLLHAALQLQDRVPLRLVLRGDGARRAAAEAFVRAHGLTNVMFLEPRPWDELGSVLAGCDVGIVSLVSGATGVATPSRMYNVLGAGRPIVAVADEDTELAMLVREHSVGWVVRPGDAAQLAALLLRLAEDVAGVRAAGERARAVAASFTRERSVASFRSLLGELASASSIATPQRRGPNRTVIEHLFGPRIGDSSPKEAAMLRSPSGPQSRM